MYLWLTSIEAINPKTGELETWAGPNVPGVTLKDAERFCNQYGFGYCKVIGKLITTIEADKIEDNILWLKN